ncbi:MAG: hypothetical protein K2W82_17400 [Candidatus Obscuribacterales bacterium]|nr:hypothetical protein [Candidatus Obscuribacterales bacterium]
MQALTQAQVTELRLSRIILVMHITAIARMSKRPTELFTGLRGRLVAGPLAGAQVFLPKRLLTRATKHKLDLLINSQQHTDWLLDNERLLEVTVFELWEQDQSLIVSERHAATIVAQRDQLILTARIEKLVHPRNDTSRRQVSGFRGTICTGALANTPVFFPSSSVPRRKIASQKFVGKNLSGVILERAGGNGFVLSEQLATKKLFDGIAAGYRLRMRLTRELGGKIHVEQCLDRGLPLYGVLDPNGRHDLKIGDEVWVAVTDKHGGEDAKKVGTLLVKAEEPPASDKQGETFCTTCQQHHSNAHFCENCEHCLLKHGYQRFTELGATPVFVCEMCNTNNEHD